MGNYEALLRMLNAANVTFSCRTTETGKEVYVRSCTGERNEGVSGLYTAFCFNLDGDLESVGVWRGEPPRALKAA